MAGILRHVESYDFQRQPVDAEITILLRSSMEPAISPAQSCRLNEYITQARTEPHVPDPIRLRGVGMTTL